MCSTCNASRNLSTEDRHRLVRLEERMTQYQLQWLGIQHRIISLTAQVDTATGKPESEQDIVEIARLSRNLGAAKLDQDNAILKMAKAVTEMKRITDAAKKAQTDPLMEAMQEFGFKPLSPDNPMYGLITGLIDGIGDIPGVTFGRPMTSNPRRGGFSPARGTDFGYPFAPPSPM